MKSNCPTLPTLVASFVLSYEFACLIITFICSQNIKHLIQKDTSDFICVGKFWEAFDNWQIPYQSVRGPKVGVCHVETVETPICSSIEVMLLVFL